MSDTIAAIATPIGEGGISIIRCSGSGALTVAQKIFYTSTGNSVNELSSHRVHYGSIYDPKKNKYIDEVILTWFKRSQKLYG